MTGSADHTLKLWSVPPSFPSLDPPSTPRLTREPRAQEPRSARRPDAHAPLAESARRRRRRRRQARAGRRVPRQQHPRLGHHALEHRRRARGAQDVWARCVPPSFLVLLPSSPLWRVELTPLRPSRTTAASWDISVHPRAETMATGGADGKVMVLSSAVDSFGDELAALEAKGSFVTAVEYVRPSLSLTDLPSGSGERALTSARGAEQGRQPARGRHQRRLRDALRRRDGRAHLVLPRCVSLLLPPHPLPPRTDPSLPHARAAHSAPIRSLSFTSTLLITASDDRRINVFDLRALTSSAASSSGGRRGQVASLGGHEGWVVNVAARNERLLASGCVAPLSLSLSLSLSLLCTLSPFLSLVGSPAPSSPSLLPPPSSLLPLGLSSAPLSPALAPSLTPLFPPRSQLLRRHHQALRPRVALSRPLNPARPHGRRVVARLGARARIGRGGGRGSGRRGGWAWRGEDGQRGRGRAPQVVERRGLSARTGPSLVSRSFSLSYI